MTRGHLVLVGMMGSGKSAVGQECAVRLRRRCVDTDDLVVETSGRTIADIWTDGEDAFRDLERAALTQACAIDAPAVIACGGGVVVDERNRRTLREAGTVVWLRARPETLAQRVGADANRPLLGADPLEVLRRLSVEREPAYLETADVVVDTDDLDIANATDAVLRAAKLGA